MHSLCPRGIWEVLPPQGVFFYLLEEPIAVVRLSKEVDNSVCMRNYYV